MKTNQTLVLAFTLIFALAAVPAFAQHGGLGVGSVLGGQTRVGGGTGAAAGAGAQAGAGNVGVKTNTGAHARTETGEGHAEGHADAHAGAGIVTRIENNPQLAANVQSMLPSGESMSAASAGFRNEGQFLAALHASHNLDIPFDQLKAKMTGSDDMSLGAAIKASKPQMSKSEAKEAAKMAELQAKASEHAKATTSAKTSTSANSTTSAAATTTTNKK